MPIAMVQHGPRETHLSPYDIAHRLVAPWEKRFVRASTSLGVEDRPSSGSLDDADAIVLDPVLCHHSVIEAVCDDVGNDFVFGHVDQVSIPDVVDRDAGWQHPDGPLEDVRAEDRGDLRCAIRARHPG